MLHAPLRRPLLVVMPWAAVLLLAVLALFVLPKQYRSSTLILIESEKVPDSFVARSPPRTPCPPHRQHPPEILSRTRLERVVAETNPYPELDSRTRAVEALRGAISVNPSGTDGFTIEFVHQDPRKAQEVAERLATLFIGEPVRARGEQVEEAVDFLVDPGQRREATSSRRRTRRCDATRKTRMGQLPEQLQTNLATMEMLQREMQAVEESLFLAREKQRCARPGHREAAGARRRAVPGQ